MGGVRGTVSKSGGEEEATHSPLRRVAEHRPVPAAGMIAEANSLLLGALVLRGGGVSCLLANQGRWRLEREP